MWSELTAYRALRCCLRSSASSQKTGRMGSKKKGPKKGPTAADQQQDSSRKPDLYTVLGLERSCSQEDIKRAYRTLALKHHPDKPGGHARG